MSVLPAEGHVFEVDIPVVVIGAGAAGLVAALSAKEQGADVLMIERDPIPRGSTAMSAGLIPAAGTRWQRDAGVTDTPAQFAADILAKAHGEPDPHLVHLMTRAAGPALEWLAEAHGLPFALLTDFLYAGHTAYRMHGLPSRSGLELIERLQAAAEAAGIDILTDAHVDTLYAESDGRVRGLGFARPDGSRDEVGCAALVLACSGFGGNPDLVACYIPELSQALYFGHVGNQGEALDWGLALGAASRHLSGYQGHGAIAHPHGIQITWTTIIKGGIQVNAAGQRFSNEAAGYSEQAAEVVRQPGAIAFNIFDAGIAALARPFEDFRQAESAGAVITADSFAELAQAIGVPADTLAATMATVDDAKRGARADAFGRTFAGEPALQPPYHAVKVTGALLHTQGGLVVDDTAKVVRADGTPLPNLYAAGGAACGVSGAHAFGYLSGNGLLSAVALGRTAGLAAGRTVRA